MSMNMNFNVTSKEAINLELSKLSDFSQIYYLERLLHEKKDISVKKYCHNKLAVIYLNKGMYSKAAENVEAIARMALSYDEKIKSFMDEVKILVAGADFLKAESIFEKVLSVANPLRKVELRKELVRIYKSRAEELEKNMKRGAALVVYERIFKIGDDIDRKEVKDKLLYYYRVLGKTHEYNRLKGM